MKIPRLTNPSVMNHDFSRVPHADIPRSTFRRSHGHKTTFDAGYLVPIYVDEALPGDTFKVNLSSVARLNTPLLPFMDNLHMDFFFFFVPNRLIWNNWQKFCGEQEDPGDSTDYLVPIVEAEEPGFGAGSLADYFGLPTDLPGLKVNALHFRAYNLIWNEWFRDENLQESLVVAKDDGDDDIGQYELRKRGKRHDYFTSCLPWPQKGDAVDLPIGSSAPVIGTGNAMGFTDGTTDYGLYSTTGAGLLVATGNLNDPVATSGAAQTTLPANLSIMGLSTNPDNTQVYADLSNATASTINSLREAFQLQRMMERDARGGTRYTEIIRSHFRVTSPDARLQRPEYLGGGSRPVTVEPIPVTGGTATGDPTGTLRATGYANQSGIGFTKSFTEHGVLIGLVNVRADLTYQRGVNRMWSRQTRYDFYWPALAHLGEQEVLNKEIYCQNTSADNDVFGYQERWAEYRYYPSMITGLLRSTHPQSLDAWHLSQDFAELPVLNASFIQEDPPIDRVVAVTEQPDFVFDGFFDVVTTRPMPMYSVPGLIDHF